MPSAVTSVPDVRVETANRAPINSGGEFVLYWMTAQRRATWNFGLQRAVEWADELHKPLVVFEALRCGYRWASDRLHYFIIQGMAENARAFSGKPVLYYPYLEPEEGAGSGLLEALAARACLIVTDEFPCFFLPRMVRAAATRLPVRLEVVDSNGLLPLRATDRVFARAVDFRRFLQKNLRPYLDQFPARDPLAQLPAGDPYQLPAAMLQQWPAADVIECAVHPEQLHAYPIDHSVAPVETRGGSRAAQTRWRRFLADGLPKYLDLRNQPQEEVSSGLSPYLHFGHISVHQVFTELMADEEWTPEELSEQARGSARGWWGCSPAAEAFLDELITWREVGYNMCFHRRDYDQFESLPEWAQETLAQHAGDPRPDVYGLEDFEAAATHDQLWNAAQRQLVREGRIHNYLRMLWGKKILHWSESPRAALEIMIELNNKYALDGRNPNSYSGIFWVLGRYDRPWGPERPIFGKVRYMTSKNTARKLNVAGYIAKYAPGDEPSCNGLEEQS